MVSIHVNIVPHTTIEMEMIAIDVTFQIVVHAEVVRIVPNAKVATLQQ